MSGQPHFELDASMKLFTELTTLAASLVRHLGRHLISAAVDSFSLTIRKKVASAGIPTLR
jgi:hypothetical protein